jgi:hypothetical protein
MFNMNEYDASSILNPLAKLIFYFKYPCLFVLAIVRFFDYFCTL